MNISEMRNVVNNLKYESWRFEIYDSHPPYLQLFFSTTDNWSDQKGVIVASRKWRLSFNMTKSEIVQTALKAVLTAVEHEVREQFTYKGAAIFGPHFDVDALLEIVNRVDVRDKQILEV